MNAKLTLKLNEAVIEKAKEYARKNKKSLSELVESFFKTLTAESEQGQTNYTPLTEELSGVLTVAELQDYQDQYADYLIKKYQ
jgi:hypothetical protein